MSLTKRFLSLAGLLGIVALAALFIAPDMLAAAGKPGKPTGLSATADDHETVSLSWNAPASGPEPGKYNIFRRNLDDSGSRISKVGTSTTTSYTDEDLSASTGYRYRVSAVANGKQGKRSSGVDVTTADAPGATTADNPDSTPQRPRSLDLSEDTAGEIVIVWTAPDSGPDPTSYKVYRADIAQSSSTVLATVDASTFTYTDDDVAEETWYGYSVTAINDAGEGPANGPDSIKSKNQTPGVPEEVTSLDVSEDTAGQVIVSWTAATNGPTPTSFKVYRERLTQGGDYGQGEVHIGTAAAGSTSYTDSPVAQGVSYEYSVRAANDAGHSGAWRRAMITTKSASE